MIVAAAHAGLSLPPGHPARLHLRAGTRLRGLRGTTWITVDGQPRDHLLEPGQAWVLPRQASLLVCALRADGHAELAIDEPAPAVRARRSAPWPVLAGALRRVQAAARTASARRFGVQPDLCAQSTAGTVG